MTRFIRPLIDRSPAYTPGEQRAGKLIKLNTNECPYTPSPRVVEAVTAAAQRLMRYPEPDADRACEALARKLGVPRACVLAANGSDETLRLVFQAYVDPGESVAWSTPTYTLYQVLANFAGARVVDVPRRADFTVPVAELAEVRAKLTILCTPNSPTGTVTPFAELEQLARTGRLLLVDEAYADFTGHTAVELTQKYDNVIVARTLSKSYALAGLRVGFAVAHPSLIDELRKLKDSYNVSMCANYGAAAALEDDAYAVDLQRRIVATRERLMAGLQKLGWKVHPTGSNFVFAEPRDRKGRAVHDFLSAAGILVRCFPDDPRTAAGIRITVGTDAEIDRLLEVLGEYGR